MTNMISAQTHTTTALSALHYLRGLSPDPDDDLMLMSADPTPLQPQLLSPSQAGEQNELCDLGSLSAASEGGLLSGGLSLPCESGLREEDGERSDMAFLTDLLSLGPGGADEFSKEWQDAFGMFDPPSVPVASGGPAARPPSNPPSPTGFLPSQLLDHSLSCTGWATPPMFQAPPLQLPPGQCQAAPQPPAAAANAASGGSKDMSAWFNLFADLDPLSNPDAIGRSADELLNA